MIETSQFQTLVAVAKARSFSRAAEQLGVTQSAISQSIKNLETKIDVKIFLRSGKRVLLTPEGEKLFELASNFLEKMDSTLNDIKYDQDKMCGNVRIGSLAGIGNSWLADELLKLGREFPDLIISTRLEDPEFLIKEFEDYKLDFLVVPEYFLPNIGERILLVEEKSVLVFPKSGEYSVSKETPLEALSKLPAIQYDKNDPIYLKWCQEKYGRIPKNINTRFVINSHNNMLHAVAEGMGIAVVPTHVLYRSKYREKISVLGSDCEVSNSKFFLVYHKGADNVLRIKTILNRLVSSEKPLIS